MQDSDGNKVGYIRMCRVLGQGTDKYGRELLQAITLKLEDNAKHGVVAQDEHQAEVGVDLMIDRLRYATSYGNKEHKTDAAVSAIAALVRYVQVCT